MTVKTITSPKKSAGKCLVTFEGGTSVNISTNQIADYGLFPGAELSCEEYDQMLKSQEISLGRARAVRILGNRSLSAGEMKKRLITNGSSEDTAQEVVQWLGDNGFINDAQYAQDIARHYIKKGYGIARIRDEMYKRGIPKELWEDGLSEIDEATIDSAADDFIAKKLRGSSDEQDLRRAADALCRRGFSYEQAKSALKRHAENEKGAS